MLHLALQFLLLFEVLLVGRDAFLGLDTLEVALSLGRSLRIDLPLLCLDLLLLEELSCVLMTLVACRVAEPGLELNLRVA